MPDHDASGVCSHASSRPPLGIVRVFTPRCDENCLWDVGVPFKLVGDEGSYVSPQGHKSFRLQL